MHTQPLIVAATHTEIAPSIPTLDKHHIPYLITGVGMVATTYSLTRTLVKASFPYILNVGIAGSFVKDMEVGSLIEVRRDTFSELGAEDHDDFRSIEELGFGISSWENIPVDGVETGLRQAQSISVNAVHGNVNSITQLLQRHPDVHAESMEGAAVFYVCTAENIPCLQVRAISNYVEARDKNMWNIPLAVQNLNSWLLGFLGL
ncbi:MAG TPA: futalosine hydrolase [Sphingobacterium sp.]|nr:futalosine hydrolase [Sphingobacterium sp.]